jgi:hypothetical protein
MQRILLADYLYCIVYYGKLQEKFEILGPENLTASRRAALVAAGRWLIYIGNGNSGENPN